MAVFTSCSFLCFFFFCIALFRASAFDSEAPLSQPHLPHHVDQGSPSNGYSMDSRIIISTLGILFFIVFTIVVLHIYAKWCWWRRAHARQRISAQLEVPRSPSPDSAKPSALDKEIVKALPTFAYKPQVFCRTNDSSEGAAEGKTAECAVCLAEFRQGEACKVLPKCGHFFHTLCIDLWFLSNSTCPLCRATPGMLAGDEEAARPPVGEAFDEECQELQRALWCKYNTSTDEEKSAQNLHILLDSGISAQGRKWKRSFSEKFCGSVNNEATPVSNHAQIPTRPPLIWGRSASYSTIYSLRDAQSLVESSSCACVLRAPSSHADCQSHHHEYQPPSAGPKSLVRLFSK